LAVCVVGLGSMGLQHLAALQRLGAGRLGAVRRRGGPLCRPAELGGVELHSGLEEALDRGYHAVVVATPSALHLESALPAARAGCHLYLEKPVSHSLEGVRELAAVAAAGRLVVQVGCQLRFEPGLELVRRWLGEGRLGRPVSARARMGSWLPDWHPWEDYRRGYAARAELGGGVLLTSIHELDYLHWLLGPLAPLAAAGGRSGALEVDVEDHLEALLAAHQGGPVSLGLDFLARPPVRRLEVLGTAGRARWDFLAGSAELWQEGRREEAFSRPSTWRPEAMVAAAQADFLASVLDGGGNRVPLSEGVAVLETALEVKRLLAEGA
jgi:predicted dehydrogenase